MLSFDEFMKEITDRIQASLASGQYDTIAEITRIPRINGRMQEGIMVHPREGTSGVVFSCRDMYAEYVKRGSFEMTYTYVMNQLLERIEHLPDIDASIYLEWDKAESRILPALVCRRMNHENLQYLANKPFEGTDLAITYNIVHEADGIRGSLQVTNRMVEQWGIDMDSVHDAAIDNMGRILSPCIFELDIMAEDGAVPGEYYSLPGIMDQDSLYIFSNKERYFGASSIMSDGILQGIADRLSGNFYMLPLSTNDMMIVAQSEETDVRQLQRILLDYNFNAHKVREILSDQVYFYDRQEEKLSVATDPEQTQEIVWQILEECLQTHDSQEDENGEMEQ